MYVYTYTLHSCMYVKLHMYVVNENERFVYYGYGYPVPIFIYFLVFFKIPGTSSIIVRIFTMGTHFVWYPGTTRRKRFATNMCTHKSSGVHGKHLVHYFNNHRFPFFLPFIK